MLLRNRQSLALFPKYKVKRVQLTYMCQWIHRKIKELDDEVLNWCTLTDYLIKVSYFSNPSLSIFQLQPEKPTRLILF